MPEVFTCSVYIKDHHNSLTLHCVFLEDSVIFSLTLVLVFVFSS